MRPVHDALVERPNPPSLAQISTEIAALEEALALKGRLLPSSQKRPDFDITIWERDAAALRGLLKRLKAEREVIAREARSSR
jgi:hypothetical protein